MSKTYGYSRVSTSKQTTDAQVELLKSAGCDQTFVEVQSGTNRKRPVLANVLDLLREGDEILVVKLDRLSRSLQDLLSIAKEIEKKGAHLRSLRDPLFDTTTPNGKLIFGILATIAEYEQDLIRSRTARWFGRGTSKRQTVRTCGGVKPRTEGRSDQAPG